MSSSYKASERSAGRHDLVFVSPPGWRAMVAGRIDLARDPLVARWADRGWPMIRRRALPNDPCGVALGLPLPPFAGKKRLSLVLQAADIMAVTRPPSLASVCGSAPRTWRATLDRLAELARRHSVDARIFGSLAWQMLTGLTYVTEQSDLDLLLGVHGDTDLDRLAAELAAIAADAPMRLDGELMREDGAAVNWREFHVSTADVLVKGIEGVRLLGRAQFMSRGTS